MRITFDHLGSGHFVTLQWQNVLESDSIATCKVCNTTQRIGNTRLTAKLIVDQGQYRLTLRAYDDALKTIAQSDNVAPCELLFVPVITHVIRN